MHKTNRIGYLSSTSGVTKFFSRKLAKHSPWKKKGFLAEFKKHGKYEKMWEQKEFREDIERELKEFFFDPKDKVDLKLLDFFENKRKEAIEEAVKLIISEKKCTRETALFDVYNQILKRSGRYEALRVLAEEVKIMPLKNFLELFLKINPDLYEEIEEHPEISHNMIQSTIFSCLSELIEKYKPFVAMKSSFAKEFFKKK